MFSVRRPASRTTANASGRRSSSVSPFSSRWRNSAVLPRSCGSVRAWTEGSRELICATAGAIRLSSRSVAVPNTFAIALSMIIADGYAVIVAACRATSRFAVGQGGFAVGQGGFVVGQGRGFAVGQGGFAVGQGASRSGKDDCAARQRTFVVGQGAARVRCSGRGERARERAEASAPAASSDWSGGRSS